MPRYISMPRYAKEVATYYIHVHSGEGNSDSPHRGFFRARQRTSAHPLLGEARGSAELGFASNRKIETKGNGPKPILNRVAPP
jgi:hypothetical protein